MSKNSVTGRFRDIEISFTIEGTWTYMSVQNLISEARQVRVMYQKSSMSGLANWRQFQLINTPVLLRLPTEVLEAYRLTFFIDNADPISARIEKILAELDVLRTELPAEDLTEETMDASDTPLLDKLSDRDRPTTLAPKIATAQQVEKVIVPRKPESVEKQVEPIVMSHEPEPVEEQFEEVVSSHEPELAEEQFETEAMLDEPNRVAETVIPSNSESHIAEPELPVTPEKEQEGQEGSSPIRIVPKSSAVSVDTNLEFKITVPSLPASALAAQRKSQASTKETYPSTHAGKRTSKGKGKGLLGQFTQAFRFSGSGKRSKTYYQEKGEAIQNEFQDQLSKLEKDYNEGYGLNLIDWKPETLCEEETAILLLNLMVNEMIAWEKETGRATPETKQLVETLTEVSMKLRQTLKQTRGLSAPSPTLFPNLLAESQRDLEKIQSECDAYLQRFTQKLIEQEKKHAAKIEVIVFKKFLIEFIRDFLFVEITKSTRANALPKRLTWFLDLVDSEIIPIEVGKTKVSPNHHKVKGACSSEFASGTIVEVVTPGLQSKDGNRVSQMAVVIEAE